MNDTSTFRCLCISLQRPTPRFIGVFSLVSSRCLISSSFDSYIYSSIMRRVPCAPCDDGTLATSLRLKTTGFWAGGSCEWLTEEDFSMSSSWAGFVKAMQPRGWNLWRFSKTDYPTVGGCVGIVKDLTPNRRKLSHFLRTHFSASRSYGDGLSNGRDLCRLRKTG